MCRCRTIDWKHSGKLTTLNGIHQQPITVMTTGCTELFLCASVRVCRRQLHTSARTHVLMHTNCHDDVDVDVRRSCCNICAKSNGDVMVNVDGVSSRKSWES